MPVFGPSILFSGQSARWTGEQKPVTDLPEVGVEARVNFESTIGERATAFLDLINDGTTAINYDWKVNSFGLNLVLRISQKIIVFMNCSHDFVSSCNKCLVYSSEATGFKWILN